MDWNSLDWKVLDRLRDRFLRGAADGESYWQSADDLAHYDATYAVRIGWKWEAVLSELRLLGWRPRGRSMLDFGCGSGIAGRRVLRAFGREAFDELLLWDQSPHAVEYAEAAAARTFPGLSVASATPGFLEGVSPIGVLVISHVLNELTEQGLAQLRRQVLRADSVLWVEPGTRDTARGLQLIRDGLRDTHTVVAPCTHQLTCPLNQPGNERHWCHFFATPPSEIFADGNWVRFGQRAGIDLRSLPYCFLALQRRDGTQPPAAPPASAWVCAEGESGKRDEAGSSRTPAQVEPAFVRRGRTDWSRVLGRPEVLKPYVRLFDCSAAGARLLTIPKRDNPALYKKMDRARLPLAARWRLDGTTILDGQLLGEEQPQAPAAENTKAADI